MTSRRADAIAPVPVSASQGPAPIDFESLLKRAIGDTAAWRSLIKAPENQERAYWALQSWKADLKAQRRVRAGRATASTYREYRIWLARQAEFERYIDMRLLELPEFKKQTVKPKAETVAALRARVGEWRTTTAALVAGVLALEDGSITPAELGALLDQRQVHVGNLGRLSLREAAPHIVEALERERHTEEK